MGKVVLQDELRRIVVMVLSMKWTNCEAIFMGVEKKMELVTMKFGGGWCKKHGDGDDDGYNYAPSACFKGDGADNDGDYEYAPEVDGDDDDGDYDYAPAA
ncbi:hypothetical protein Ccrd_009960 [Cynara cardunculus var. scolymus]|uniref:Uncharacterized protein n=1 Tax=Cynara cardunculus var. scolymus TaxID=59895 RepID=A0A103YM47_CYNCS|nr:hypothetical protein Ccrd_009960 [Cynara cardunculus var. scolymus]